ncbi:MAG: hypothetical protein FWD23_04385 [Oscillospiraceae bacterium]|nr:hypothetical protein [Oscillospiraceae bacterium]
MADKRKKARITKPIAGQSGAKSSVMEDIWQNYDAVFKDAVTMFKDKSLDFFGLPEDITITEPLKTETTEIVVKSEFADLTFKLSNGKGMHLESEADLSKNDLFRFCHYHVDLIRAYGIDFTTVIFVKDEYSVESLDYEMLQFKPVVINCGGYDADEILAKLQARASAGEPLNELEAIYLPLFKSAKYSPAELLTESIRLISAAKIGDEQKLKISALALVLSNKLVSAEKIESIWRELKMMRLKVLEYGLRQSMEEGMEKGMEEGIARGMEKGMEKGMEEGMEKATNQIKRIKSLFITEHLSPAEIAGKEQITEDKVAEILEILGLLEF